MAAMRPAMGEPQRPSPRLGRWNPRAGPQRRIRNLSDAFGRVAACGGGNEAFSGARSGLHAQSDARGESIYKLDRSQYPAGGGDTRVYRINPGQLSRERIP